LAVTQEDILDASILFTTTPTRVGTSTGVVVYFYYSLNPSWLLLFDPAA